MTTGTRPQQTHHYQSALFNSSRWDDFIPRNDDIIITTSYKAGATQESWKDNSNFFHQGTNKRWQGVLTEEQSGKYQELAKRELGDDLAHWLEFGGRIN